MRNHTTDMYALLAEEYGGDWSPYYSNDSHMVPLGYSGRFDRDYGQKLAGFLKENYVVHAVETRGAECTISVNGTGVELLALAARRCDKFRKPEHNDRTVEKILKGEVVLQEQSPSR